MGIRVFNKDVTSVAEESKKNDLLLGSVPAASMYSNSELESFVNLSNSDIGPNVMIAHMTDDQLETALKKLNTTQGTIIRCSSAAEGRRQHNHITLKSFVVLELRPSYEKLYKQDWKLIVNELKKDVGVAKKIVSGDIPKNLIQYFGKPVYHFIPALLLLCKLYLKVRAENIEPLKNASKFGEPFWSVSCKEAEKTEQEWKTLMNRAKKQKPTGDDSDTLKLLHAAKQASNDEKSQSELVRAAVEELNPLIKDI